MDCIHCGLCLSQCPTYAEEGLEADSPRGRIYIMRSLAEGRAEPTPALVDHLDLCLACRACETACPSGVQYGHLIEGTRAYLREHYRRPWQQRLTGKLVETFFPHPGRMELALLPVRVLRRTGVLPLLRRLGVMQRMGVLGDMEALLPELPPMRRRLQFPERVPARGVCQGAVGMITGCVMQVMQTPLNEATARVLSRSGCEVAAPRTQVCCGALHAHNGDIEGAKDLARRNIEVFEKWEREHGPLDAIIINAAGCGAALKEYPGWFKDDPAWEPRAQAFSSRVRDVAEFLAQEPYRSRLQQLMQAGPGAGADSSSSGDSHLPDLVRQVMPNTAGAATVSAVNHSAAPGKQGLEQAQADANSVSAASAVDGDRPHDPHLPSTPQDLAGNRQPARCRLTYHDACHLAHGQGIRAEPRALLEQVPGFEAVPLAESEMCCGSAGSYNITQPAMALQLLERKMKHIAASGAAVVVTGNPGCIMQMAMGARRHNVPVQVRHTVEILDAATRLRPPSRSRKL